MAYGACDNAIEASLNLQEDALRIHKEFSKDKNCNLTNVCMDCGKEIPEARLIALPNANHCIRCAEIEEKRSKQYAKFKFRDIYCP